MFNRLRYYYVTVAKVTNTGNLSILSGVYPIPGRLTAEKITEVRNHVAHVNKVARNRIHILSLVKLKGRMPL